MATGEFDFIERLRRRLGGASRPGEVFVGDDAAVLRPPPGGTGLLFATDLVVEGVHFDPALCTLADAGWKAVAVNVSDVAAMGGRARYAVAAVSAPPGTDLDELAGGMIEAAQSYGLELVGGDLSGGDKVVVAVSVLGECGRRGAVLRSGATPGDEIWVTGPLGSSAAGLRSLAAGGPVPPELASAYRRPVARAEEGVAAAEAGATAMIDVSDGLSADLARVAVASGVGFRLDSLPVAPGATAAEAIGGGEDYELVFTARPGRGVPETFAAAGLRPPIRIGACTGDAGLYLLAGAPLVPRGFEHRFSTGASTAEG